MDRLPLPPTTRVKNGFPVGPKEEDPSPHTVFEKWYQIFIIFRNKPAYSGIKIYHILYSDINFCWNVQKLL
jgi:hypothetical protein